MKKTERINGFDALRTIAMWLGIVLHSIIVYKSTPEPNWPQDPTFSIAFFDWLYSYIHLFRMPLFFLVAGFFARLVIHRSGTNYFIMQRLKRILIPFVIGVVVIVPLTLLPFHFYQLYNIDQTNIKQAIQGSFARAIRWNGMAHLWFLYYLLFFYGMNACIYKLSNKYKLKMWTFSFSKEHQSLATFSIAVAILFGSMHFFQTITPPVYTGLRPTTIHFVYYGFFYLAGWLLQINMNSSVESLANKSWPLFSLGTLLFIIQPFLNNNIPLSITYFIAAVETVSLVAGIIGLFLRYYNKDNKMWRYFSDASYWVYLVHMCFVATTQVLLINSSVPGWLRLPIVLLVTFSLSLVTYHILVRYTMIGNLLHGKREKKSIEKQAPYLTLNTA